METTSDYCKNLTNNPRYLGNGARQHVYYYYSHVGSRIWSFGWY